MTEVAKTFSKVRGSKASKGPRWLGAVVLRFMPEDKRELLHVSTALFRSYIQLTLPL